MNLSSRARGGEKGMVQVQEAAKPWKEKGREDLLIAGLEGGTAP